MAKRLRPWDVLCSPASEARFVVIEAGTAKAAPETGGAVMVRGKRQRCSIVEIPAADCDLLGGQRYADPVTGLVLLCVRPGRGPLCYEGRQMSPVRQGYVS